RKGQPERRELVEIRLDLDLTNRAAEHGDTRHAGYGQQLGLQLPLGAIAQRVRIELARNESDLQQIHGARDEWRESRCSSSRGQRTGHLCHPPRNALPRTIRVSAIRKVE